MFSKDSGYVTPEGTFTFNGCTIQDYNNYVLIKAPYGTVYKYSTSKGKYCFTFPGVFIKKYRTLFFDRRDDDDILYCMTMSTVLDGE